ncbi:MAG: hypothetical protein B0W54_23405 [Cellvibrio sp. 79]|nr:MAG: hypothetical protein B0W54_23405 [Cellvibrio sp. 79]
MEKTLWIMSFRVRILKASPLAMGDSECAAAEGATFAHSNEDARSQLLQQLENAKLELVESYQNSSFENAKWFADSEHRDDILQLIEEVNFSGEFRFGIFRDEE